MADLLSPTATAPSFSAGGIPRFGGLTQARIDWLLSEGVTIDAMIHPSGIRMARGSRAGDGFFEVSAAGAEWLAFDVFDSFGAEIDVACWQPECSEMATWFGRAFALGEHVIDDPWTYSFDKNLTIHKDPLTWLRAGRDGIVIVDPARAFDRLRDVPRVALPTVPMGQRFRDLMKPAHLPEIYVDA